MKVLSGQNFLDLCRHVRPDVHLHSSPDSLLCLLQEFGGHLLIDVFLAMRIKTSKR